MAFTYDVSTDIGKVRLLITDTDDGNPIFDDSEITSFLTQTAYGGVNDVRLAAALALETIATSEALIQKKIKLLDLSTDGPAVSDALMKRAEVLRKEADEEVTFDWAEWGLTDFNKREILLKDQMRNE